MVLWSHDCSYCTETPDAGLLIQYGPGMQAVNEYMDRYKDLMTTGSLLMS